MRELRTQSKKNPKVKKPENNILSKRIIPNVQKKDEDSLFQSTLLDQSRLSFEIETLKAENKKLRDAEILRKSKIKLNKNEEKLLTAIRSEVINQSTHSPTISRSKFLKKLGMNSKYLDDSINGLLDKKIISRVSVKYSKKIMTSSWKIL